MLKPWLTSRTPAPVRFDGEDVDGPTLQRRTVALAAKVTRQTPRPVLVAVEASSTPGTLVAVSAGLLAELAVLPVPPDTTDNEQQALFTSLGVQARLDPDEGIVPLAPDDHGEIPELPPIDEPMLVLATSGTTGPPKGVEVTLSAMAADLDGLAEAWEWDPHDRLVHGLPLFHVHGLVLGCFGPLRRGSPLIHTGRPTPERYASADGTLYFGVPTVWSRISREPDVARRLRHARLLVSGSAALPLRVRADLAAGLGVPSADVPLLERYGMTETLITVAQRSDAPGTPGHVGVPVPGVEVRLVPPDDDPSGPAELQVRGSTLFRGYRGQPEATAAAFTPDGWFRTGDLALLGKGGQYRIVGRASVDLIKSGGYRIGAGEVEDALRQSPLVHDVAVVGRPDRDLGEILVAYVELVPGVVADDTTSDRITGQAADHLAWHKHPRHIVLVDQLPRTPLGKVVKSSLRRRASPRDRFPRPEPVDCAEADPRLDVSR